MKVKTAKTSRGEALILVRNAKDKKTGCLATSIRINADVEVGVRDGYLCFWTAGREVRIGPLTPDQAEKVSEDLGYEAARD